MAAMATLDLHSMHAIEYLQQWGREAEGQVQIRTTQAANEAAKAWWRWVDEQIRKGAGALHAYTKRDEQLGSAPMPVLGKFGPSTSIKAQLDHDRSA